MYIKKLSISIIIILSLVSGLLAQTGRCECPTLTVIQGNAVNSGEVITFFAKLEGFEKEILETANFNWSIDKGSIISGQGTSTIQVATEGLEDTVITATVEVTGGWCPVCETVGSEVGIVMDKIRPKLVESIYRITCEDTLARLDAFMIELQNDPNATAYVITYDEKGNYYDRLFNEFRIRKWLELRRFPANRIVYIHGGQRTGTEIELWIAPQGADTSEIGSFTENSDDKVEKTKESVNFNETGILVSNEIKPFIFTSDFVDGVGGCSNFNPKLYATALQKNPQSRGNIVIFETSNKNFRDKEKEILDQLTEYQIERTRLKTFFVKVKQNELKEGIELWLLP